MAKAKAKSKAKGTAKGTFAGRRPPTKPEARLEFDAMKAHYLECRFQAVVAGAEEGGAGGHSSGAQRRRKFSPNQNEYWKAMKMRMAELAAQGVEGGDRMRQAAAEWKKQKGITTTKGAAVEAQAEGRSYPRRRRARRCGAW